MQNAESNYDFYMSEDLSSYSGEWVAISNNKIISHGKDVRMVAKEAMIVCGNKKFLLSKIPSNETLIF
ncbi:MAG: DUF5678 domain-containing protein [Nanoarchaeota archaeon]